MGGFECWGEVRRAHEKLERGRGIGKIAFEVGEDIEEGE